VSLIGLALSLLVVPWVTLSWWKVFRRCISIAAAISLWLFISRFERRSLASYGCSLDGAGKRELVFGCALGIAALGLMATLGLASGACRIEVTPDRLKLWRTLLGFIPAAALVSLLEELVFRGVILQHLAACSKWLAVALSSSLYAAVHLKAPTITLMTGLELGGLFLLGVVLAVSYLRTNRLALAIGLHAILAYGARVNKLLIEFPDASLAWLVGTSRLVNGLAGWGALLAIVGMVMWWTRSSNRGGVRYGHTGNL
jgi:membrane protease YdiL (CAAX protease family)